MISPLLLKWRASFNLTVTDRDTSYWNQNRSGIPNCSENGSPAIVTSSATPLHIALVIMRHSGWWMWADRVYAALPAAQGPSLAALPMGTKTQVQGPWVALVSRCKLSHKAQTKHLMLLAICHKEPMHWALMAYNSVKWTWKHVTQFALSNLHSAYGL